ncbi:WD40 repeat domain-containing protein [Kitasatospora sp. NPDC059973]|uniref:WD40 repeat domain-containing protein n=1 Tax=Kitasatospora sp. NPDC059973 TaxID=3347020 RepID=UPI003697FC5C
MAARASSLWDISDPDHPVRIGPAIKGDITALAFSRDGKTLAVNGEGTGVRLWNVSDPAHPSMIGSPLEIRASAATAMAFSPDGQTLATGGRDNTVRLWPLTVGASIRQICANTDTPTRQQWAQYLPVLPYHPDCG